MIILSGMPRLLKQIIIAAVFFGAVGLVVYYSFFMESREPVITPAISIQPPIVVSQKLLKIGPLDYDFLAVLKNPNFDFGATDVIYEAVLFGQAGNLINTLTGSISLLPGQTRYEIISSIKTAQEISNIVFKITNADWQKLKEYIPQVLFSVKNQEYEQNPPRLKGTLSNKSNFDFDQVDIHVVLFDESNEVLAVNKTDVRTFLAGTDRFFEVMWLKPVEGRVNRIQIDAYTDVLKNENFLKEHGTQEKFQKFY